MIRVTLTILWADSADDKLMIFFLFFSRKFDLTPKETIFMKCQILFSRKKNEKNILKCNLLKFLPITESVRKLQDEWQIL